MNAHTIELNLRLDVADQDNSAQAIDKREAQALAVLGDCLNHRADFRVNGVKVPRLVIGLNPAGWDGARLHQLAEQLHQACIAVFYPEQGCGELVGPGAAACGAFDLAQFQRLDEITLYGLSTGFGWDQDDTNRFRAARGLPA